MRTLADMQRPAGYFVLVLEEYYPGHKDRKKHRVLFHRGKGWEFTVLTELGKSLRTRRAVTFAELIRKLEDVHLVVTPDVRRVLEDKQC